MRKERQASRTATASRASAEMIADSGAVAAGCILGGFDQGATIWKPTGLPRQDAASMRRGRSVSGYTPVHAARASKLTKGSHSGSTGVNRAMSRPAAVNSAGPIGSVRSRRRLLDLRRNGGQFYQTALRIQDQSDHSRSNRRRIVEGNRIVRSCDLQVLRALAIPEANQRWPALGQQGTINRWILRCSPYCWNSVS